MKRGSQAEPKPCPIDDCTYESLTFIDLLRHMVESERHSSSPLGHQEWLAEALGKEFAEYAFRKDRKIVNLFAKYCRETGNILPNYPQIFNDWLTKNSKKTIKLKSMTTSTSKAKLVR